jgi:hypothetical protein
MRAQFVADALMLPIWRRGECDAVVHHSAAAATSEPLRADHGARCLMSRSGTCESIAAMENFFCALKTGGKGPNYLSPWEIQKEGAWCQPNRPQLAEVSSVCLCCGLVCQPLMELLCTGRPWKRASWLPFKWLGIYQALGSRRLVPIDVGVPKIIS